MTPTEATAEIFLTAFMTLPQLERETFFSKVLQQKSLREDLIDLAIAENRKREKTRPFVKAIADIKSSRN